MPPRPPSRHRRSRLRHHRALMLWHFAEQTRISINSVSATEPVLGDAVHEGQPRRIRRPVSVVESVWCSLLRESQRVLQACRMSAAATLTGASALQDLSRSATGDAYGPWSAGARYVPFVGELMAEPAADHPVISLLDALPPEVAGPYSHLENILLEGGEPRVPEGEAPDAAFGSILCDRKEYLRYLRRPEVQALWTLIPADDAKATVSLAAVRNKNGDSIEEDRYERAPEPQEPHPQ